MLFGSVNKNDGLSVSIKRCLRDELVALGEEVGSGNCQFFTSFQSIQEASLRQVLCGSSGVVGADRRCFSKTTVVESEGYSRCAKSTVPTRQEPRKR